MALRDLSSKSRALYAVIAAVVWAIGVKIAGYDLLPFPWLLSALFLGIAVFHTWHAIDEA